MKRYISYPSSKPPGCHIRIQEGESRFITKAHSHWENGYYTLTTNGKTLVSDTHINCKFDAHRYYKGTIKDGKFHGNGHWVGDSFEYKGGFKNGLMDGNGVLKRTGPLSEREEEEGSYPASLIIPEDTYTFEGEFRAGAWRGIGCIRIVDNTSYDGEFSAGQCHGTGTFCDHNTTLTGVFEGNICKTMISASAPDGTVFDFLNHKITGPREILLRAKLENPNYDVSGFYFKAGTLALLELVQPNSPALTTTRTALENTIELNAHFFDLIDAQVTASATTPIIMSGGFREHAISFVAFDHQLYICNRGNGAIASQFAPYIHQVIQFDFSQDATGDANPELTRCITQFCDVSAHEKSETDFINVMMAYIELGKRVTCDVPHITDVELPQSIGNCWFASPLVAATVVLALGSATESNTKFKIDFEQSLSKHSQLRHELKVRSEGKHSNYTPFLDQPLKAMFVSKQLFQKTALFYLD